MKSICWMSLVFAVLTSAAFTQSNPVPLINNPLVPDAVVPGGASFTLTINGTGFVAGSVVNWNGVALATTFVSSSQLTVTVPAANIATVGTASITVRNPPPASSSNVEFFAVRAPFSESSFGLSGFGPVSTIAAWIIADDLNGDGRQDLVTTGSDGIYVALGNGDGTFQQAVNYSVGDSANVVVASDFNGDGILDLVVGTGQSPVVILIGNGDGTFQPYQTTSAQVYLGIAAGDFNGDGHQDLALTAGPYVGIALGNGDGTFQNPVYYSVSNVNYSYYIAAGDFNGDGKLDLAVTVEADGTIAVLPGNGDGTFQTAIITSLPYLTGDVVAADFNQDGKPDLAVYVVDTARREQGEMAVLISNGNGTFQSPAYYLLGGFSFVKLAAADINGDGYLDLEATSMAGGNTQSPASLTITYLGRGDGTFSRNENYFPVGSSSVSSLTLADFNNDGMLDMAAGNSGETSQTPVSVMLQSTAVLSRTKVVFPNTKVGSSNTEKVTLTNISKSSLSIGKISLNGNGATSFSQTNNCGKALGAGASCTINITFAPTFTKKFLDVRLEVANNAVSSRQIVYIRGISVAN
jgi:hypothetical protein